MSITTMGAERNIKYRVRSEGAPCPHEVLYGEYVPLAPDKAGLALDIEEDCVEWPHDPSNISYDDKTGILYLRRAGALLVTGHYDSDAGLFIRNQKPGTEVEVSSQYTGDDCEVRIDYI